jgi:hypothetical protein
MPQPQYQGLRTARQLRTSVSGIFLRMTPGPNHKRMDSRSTSTVRARKSSSTSPISASGTRAAPIASFGIEVVTTSATTARTRTITQPGWVCL